MWWRSVVCILCVQGYGQYNSVRQYNATGLRFRSPLYYRSSAVYPSITTLDKGDDQVGEQACPPQLFLIFLR